MTKSMLAAVAEAAGLSLVTEASAHSAPAASTPQNPEAVAVVLTEAARRSQVRKVSAPISAPAPYESKEAKAYTADLEARGRTLDTASRNEIIDLGMTWDRSPDIRAEFGAFANFASYMRARKRGGASMHRG